MADVKPYDIPEGYERVLLVGGPYHFRTVLVKMNAYEVHCVIPTETSMFITPGEPMSCDFKSARYARSTELLAFGQTHGWLFEYTGTA